MNWMFDVLEMHRRLAHALQPSGGERTGAGAVLAEIARPFVDEVRFDAMGNLICHKKGSGKRVMLAAHMDGIGFMVTGADDGGFLSIHNLGWHDPAGLINQRVVLSGGLRGILRPRNNLESRWSAITMEQLYLDIGAASRQEAMEKAPVGTMAVFDSPVTQAAGGRIMGPYADDLAGCVALLIAMEGVKTAKYDAYFVFSVQEEVGCRGARTAALAIQPEIAIACDVCDSDDIPLEKHLPRVVTLGKGPAVKIKDSSVICSPELNSVLKETAQKADIPIQDEIMLYGGTDTSAMQLSVPNGQAAYISIPTRHIHSPAEVYDRQDVEWAGALLAAFLNQ